MPSISMLAPFGRRPWKVPRPLNVPRARQRTAARSFCAVTERTSKRTSGNAAKSSPKKRRKPSGMRELLDADEGVDARRLPVREGRVDIVVVERREVGAGDAGRSLLPGRLRLGRGLRAHTASITVSSASTKVHRARPVQPALRAVPIVAACRRARIRGTVRAPAGGAAALAGGLRSAPRRGEKAREAGARGRRPLADPAQGGRQAARARPARRRRAAAGAGRRLRPRPPLVAGPDGPHDPAAGRADDAELARLVRDRRRRPVAAQPGPERALPPARAGLVRGPARRRDDRPGDADLALGQREHEGAPERELRPRADGAVHARRRRRATPRTTSASRRGR